ncbi:MAG: hypothetical protein KDA65_11360 [Planctomycetaceae bacterium]|nr:hypothetical protein [Planctomycetaceae bacterium]
MSDFLLKVNAVNFDRFITDTDDLATIRGGGLLLRNATAFVKNVIKAESCNIITEGNSSFLLLIKEIDDLRAQEYLRTILEHLSSHEKLKYACFVGAIVEYDEKKSDVKLNLKELETLCRIRQIQELDLRLPAFNREAVININGERNRPRIFCDIEGVRPREQKSPQNSAGVLHDPALPEFPRDDAIVNSSVAIRRNHGREHKTQLLKEMAGINSDEPLFHLENIGNIENTTWHFDDLTTKYKLNSGNDKEQVISDPGVPSALAGKMAIIYLDGNGLSKAEEKASSNLAKLKEWEASLKSHQQTQVKALLHEVRERPEGWIVTTRSSKLAGYVKQDELENQLRLEVLLWGGDDCIWVVPAWKGLEFLEHFFRPVNTQDLGDNFSFSAGVVFANHKVPIRDTVSLAARLLSSAKKLNREGSSGNRFAYQILESFDHVGEDYDRIRNGQLPKSLSFQDYIINAEQLTLLREAKSRLETKSGQNGIPSTRRRAILNALYRTGTSLEEHTTRLAQVSNLNVEQIRLVRELPYLWNDPVSLSDMTDDPTVMRQFPSAAVWMHLFNIWDYLV